MKTKTKMIPIKELNKNPMDWDIGYTGIKQTSFINITTANEIIVDNPKNFIMPEIVDGKWVWIIKGVDYD